MPFAHWGYRYSCLHRKYHLNDNELERVLDWLGAGLPYDVTSAQIQRYVLAVGLVFRDARVALEMEDQPSDNVFRGASEDDADVALPEHYFLSPMGHTRVIDALDQVCTLVLTSKAPPPRGVRKSATTPAAAVLGQADSDSDSDSDSPMVSRHGGIEGSGSATTASRHPVARVADIPPHQQPPPSSPQPNPPDEEMVVDDLPAPPRTRLGGTTARSPQPNPPDEEMVVDDLPAPPRKRLRGPAARSPQPNPPDEEISADDPPARPRKRGRGNSAAQRNPPAEMEEEEVPARPRTRRRRNDADAPPGNPDAAPVKVIAVDGAAPKTRAGRNIKAPSRADGTVAAPLTRGHRRKAG